MDISELKSYFDLFPDDVYCWIGGGAVRSLFDNTNIKDVDVFTSNRQDKEKINDYLLSNGAVHLGTADILERFLIDGVLRIDVFCEIGEYGGCTPEDSVVWSDYTIAAGAVDCRGNMFYHSSFIKDSLEKRLIYLGNDITESQALNRPNRLRRFINIGYDIDKENTLKLLDRMCVDKIPLRKERWKPIINKFHVETKTC